MGIINVNIDKILRPRFAGRGRCAERRDRGGQPDAVRRQRQGRRFSGWVSLPGRIGSEELEAVEACAPLARIARRCDRRDRDRGIVPRDESRVRSDERLLPVVAQEAGQAAAAVRGAEPERGLSLGAFGRREALSDRCDRHFQVGHDDRAGRRVPPDQRGDRVALRQGRGVQADRRRDRRQARSPADTCDARRLCHVRDSR